MIDLAKKIINFYIENSKTPTLDDLDIEVNDKKGSIFVTLYKNGEVIGSAGNIVEIENSTNEELIKSCIGAIEDKRFKKIDISDLNNIKIRIDEIIEKNLLKDKEITSLNPSDTGIIVIKKDYDDLAVLLPNISANINVGKDFILVLDKKLKSKYKKDDYLNYEIKTKITTNY
ncbi:MAG: AMMECR1 domain-containing protein [Candidatus Gracilibacteria bacterium]|nr:AMMECR1 domain-containing protein [Candidatus Gracilibacteria bacterium]